MLESQSQPSVAATAEQNELSASLLTDLRDRLINFRMMSTPQQAITIATPPLEGRCTEQGNYDPANLDSHVVSDPHLCDRPGVDSYLLWAGVRRRVRPNPLWNYALVLTACQRHQLSRSLPALSAPQVFMLSDKLPARHTLG
jgi:hypothetical protein